MIMPFTNTAAARVVSLEEMVLIASPNVTVDPNDMRHQGLWELHGSWKAFVSNVIFCLQRIGIEIFIGLAQEW